LPELLGLVVVLEHERVQVTLAPDLELGLADVLLYPCGCVRKLVPVSSPVASLRRIVAPCFSRTPTLLYGFDSWLNVQEASLRRQISMNDLMSDNS